MSENKTEEIQRAFSEVASEFAQETGKKAEENPDSLKAENLPPPEQMEFNARFFKQYYSFFCNVIDELPKKSAARVIKRIMGYPLETPSEMTWTSEKEKNAFLVGNQLAEVKFLMYKYVISEQMTKETMEKLKEENKQLELPLEEGKVNG